MIQKSRERGNLLTDRGISTKLYTNISYSRNTNKIIRFEGHGFKNQGHIRLFPKNAF